MNGLIIDLNCAGFDQYTFINLMGPPRLVINILNNNHTIFDLFSGPEFGQLFDIVLFGNGLDQVEFSSLLDHFIHTLAHFPQFVMLTTNYFYIEETIIKIGA